MLAVSPSTFESALSYKTKILEEVHTIFLDPDGASDNCDTLCSLLFA